MCLLELELDANLVAPYSLAELCHSFVGADDQPNFLRGTMPDLMTGLNMAQEMPQPASERGIPLTMPNANKILCGTCLMDPITFVPPKVPTSASYSDACSMADSHLVQRNLFPCLANKLARSGESESSSLTGMLQRTEDTQAASYKVLLKLTSLSIKVFNCVPGNLPAGLRNELLHAVSFIPTDRSSQAITF